MGAGMGMSLALQMAAIPIAVVGGMREARLPE